MKHDYFIVQNPATPARQLLLLLHGAGDNPVSMGELGRWFAPLFPEALVVCIGAPLPCGPAPGREWFSSHGADEENLQPRIDATLPVLIESVRYWQQHSGVTAQATALIGFSQGAVMALECIKAIPRLAGRVIAFNGRYGQLPENADTFTTVHLIHGEYDDVIDVRHAQDAADALMREGGDVTLDIVEDLGHAIDQRSMQLALDHLQYTIPKHYFDEMLSGDRPTERDVIALR